MKNFTTYYYNISSLWNINYTKAKENINLKLWFNDEGYEIIKIDDDNFFIHLIKKYQSEILPKKWKQDDINNLKTIELEDWEWLFTDVFIFINLKYNDILSNSLWIIWVLKAGAEISLPLLGNLLQEIFDINNTTTIEPIFFKNSENYLENNIKKITELSFSIASVNTQRNLWVNDEDWLWKAFKIKEELGWDTLTFSVWAKEWLSIAKIKSFLKKYRHLYSKSPRITVDEFWKIIKQEIDRIRFKSVISLELVKWELNNNDVLISMKKDFDEEIDKIKKEYNYN